MAEELADCEAQAKLELEQGVKPWWWASEVEKIKEGIATYEDRAAAATSAADAKDASRYRWLRKQHWSNSLFCVVRNPKKSVKFGMDCPNFELLDNAIDAAMAAAPSSEIGGAK